MENQIIKVIKDNELVSNQAEIIQQTFNQYFEAAKKWEDQVKTIVITDASQTEEMKKARTARLALRDIRINAEKEKDRLKKDSLRYNKAVDGVNNVIKALTEPLEEYLSEQEKFVERAEETKKVEIQHAREADLAPYVQDVSFYNLKEMSEAGFQELLSSSRTAYETRMAKEKQAEEDRIKAEKEAQEERERMKAENARLKAEADEREAKARAEREEQERKLEEQRKILEEKARVEREAREKAEEEIKRKEQEEKEKQEAEAQAKKEAELAPDKEKLFIYAQMLNNVQIPLLTTEEARNKLMEATKMLAAVTKVLKME